MNGQPHLLECNHITVFEHTFGLTQCETREQIIQKRRIYNKLKFSNTKIM
jgi:hypothetical protein